MEAKYFFSINEKQVGPLTNEQIQERINNGSINGMTLAWCQGMADWRPVSHIDELKGMVLPQPIQPPPLPKPAVAGVPEGLSSLEAWAYKFVMTLYRQWGKRPVPLREYVIKNPKRAIPVAAGTIAVIVVVLAIIFSVGSEPCPLAPGAGQAGYSAQQMPPAGWQAQHRAVMDAQQFTSEVTQDAYEYRRDAQDRMDDVYRRGTYDFMNDD